MFNIIFKLFEYALCSRILKGSLEVLPGSEPEKPKMVYSVQSVYFSSVRYRKQV